MTGYHAENDEDTPTEIRMQAPGKVTKTFAASVSVCRVPQKILEGRSEELKKAILAIVDRLDGLWVPSTCPRVVNDKSESYPTSDVAGILHPAFGLIAIPKISEMGAAEGDTAMMTFERCTSSSCVSLVRSRMSSSGLEK